WGNLDSAAELGCGRIRGKAVAHLLAIGFFAGLLVLLAVILEQIVKAHWAEIVAALKGEAIRPSQPAMRVGAVARRAAA
ncbi:MAG: hypothetical protein AB7H79_00370, partial [Sphingomonas sp.]